MAPKRPPIGPAPPSSSSSPQSTPRNPATPPAPPIRPRLQIPSSSSAFVPSYPRLRYLNKFEHFQRLPRMKEQDGLEPVLLVDWKLALQQRKEKEEGQETKETEEKKKGKGGKGGEKKGKKRTYTNEEKRDTYVSDEDNVVLPSKEKGGTEEVEKKKKGKVGGTREIWRTRRTEDGKTFLATEYEDNFGIMDVAKETLLRLFNHPNLVCLIDVVQYTQAGLAGRGYTVWEDCVGGTLNRLLWCKDVNDDPVKLPESLCWHVLDGISQALLWLHHGHKHTFPFNHHMLHDDDWHPILVSEITPANIYFAAREGGATYGDVKLGNFRSAAVLPSTVHIQALKPLWLPQLGPYVAPEIRGNISGVSDASEIWSLGAVLYHMMTGSPPEAHDSSGETAPVSGATFGILSLPPQYSPKLRDIVMKMLMFDRKERPTVGDLSELVDGGWAAWREDTEEGKRVVMKGSTKRRNRLALSDFGKLFPGRTRAGDLGVL